MLHPVYFPADWRHQATKELELRGVHDSVEKGSATGSLRLELHSSLQQPRGVGSGALAENLQAGHVPCTLVRWGHFRVS